MATQSTDEQKINVLSLFKQGLNDTEAGQHTKCTPDLLRAWYAEHCQAEKRLEQLQAVLSHCTAQGGTLFTAGERIHINQERARLMRDLPELAPYPYPGALSEKISKTINTLKSND